ncbi:hypothetical protein [Solimonas variicoloris]|uniref:hypothetical protein n=1 Tax=Solimonas variicoloris TaxID=254408 RepID=UPI000381D7CA|nr:hypothetical protein [Solimonas variicoloris]
MNGELPRPPYAARAALGGYLQISARGRHRRRSMRFAAPALAGFMIHAHTLASARITAVYGR